MPREGSPVGGGTLVTETFLGCSRLQNTSVAALAVPHVGTAGEALLGLVTSGTLLRPSAAP